MAGQSNQRETGRDLARVTGCFGRREEGSSQFAHSVSSVTELKIAAEKKSKVAAERNNHKRGWFWRKVKQIAHERLRFIDESGVITILTRLFGRAKPGERVVESVPRNYQESTSVISLLGLQGVEATIGGG